jgi:hypothetical protein
MNNVDEANFAMYIENNYISIRVYDHILSYRIPFYEPGTNFRHTVYHSLELLYNQITITKKQSSFTLVDEDQFLTMILYKHENGADYLTLTGFTDEAILITQVWNYILTTEDIAHMKEFMITLKAYLETFLEVSFFRMD